MLDGRRQVSWLPGCPAAPSRPALAETSGCALRGRVRWLPRSQWRVRAGFAPDFPTPPTNESRQSTPSVGRAPAASRPDEPGRLLHPPHEQLDPTARIRRPEMRVCRIPIARRDQFDTPPAPPAFPRDNRRTQRRTLTAQDAEPGPRAATTTALTHPQGRSSPTPTPTPRDSAPDAGMARDRRCGSRRRERASPARTRRPSRGVSNTYRQTRPIRHTPAPSVPTRQTPSTAPHARGPRTPNLDRPPTRPRLTHILKAAVRRRPRPRPATAHRTGNG